MNYGEKQVGTDTVYIEDATFDALKEKRITIHRIAPMSYLQRAESNEKFFDNYIEIKAFNELDNITFTASLEKYKYSKSIQKKPLAELMLEHMTGKEDKMEDFEIIDSIYHELAKEVSKDLYLEDNVLHTGLELDCIGIIELHNQVINVFNKVVFGNNGIQLLNNVKTIYLAKEDLKDIVVKILVDDNHHIIIDNIKEVNEPMNNDRSINIFVLGAVNLSKRFEDFVVVQQDVDESFEAYGIRLLKEINEDKRSVVFDLDIDL